MTHPTASSLPSLATPDDIVDRLGRNLTQVEAARVDAMLRDGSAIIRRRARQTFTYIAQDALTLVADTGVIVLPGKPISSVDSVSWDSGLPGAVAFPVTWFIWDGVDTITIPSPAESGIINLPYSWYGLSWHSESFFVIFSHGYQDVPADIEALLCSAIISELSTPTMSATLQSETIGAYSYSMRRNLASSSSVGGGSAMAGLYAALRDFGMDELLADYRQSVGTLAVRH